MAVKPLFKTLTERSHAIYHPEASLADLVQDKVLPDGPLRARNRHIVLTGPLFHQLARPLRLQRGSSLLLLLLPLLLVVWGCGWLATIFVGVKIGNCWGRRG